jgi:hypothetical protein
MGFNLGAFIGGAATRGSEIIQEREARMLELQDEQRRIAQANAAKAAAKREAELEEMEELTGKLSLFYTEDQVKDILSNGKIAANYAVAQGATYAEAGLNPSAEYEMPASKIASGVSKATVDNKPSMGTMGGEATPLIKTDKTLEAIPAGEPTRGGSFAGRFKAIPDKVTTSAKTFEAHLVELTNAKANARDEGEATQIQNQIDQVISAHQKFKSDAKGEFGNTAGLDFSKSTRQSIIRGEMEKQLIFSGKAKKGVDGQLEMLQTGNEADLFAMRYTVYENLTNSYGKVDDEILQSEIAAVKKDADRAVSAYKIGKMRAGAVVDDNKKTQQEVQAAAVGGQYKNGDVVAYTRGDGSVGYALITNDGVFF